MTSLRHWLPAAALALACTLPARAGDDALYRALGSEPGIARLVDGFLARLKADARMKPFFDDIDEAPFKKHLAEQFCVVSGGPCTYGGESMKKSHEGVDITRTDFNALVEVLQQSLQAEGVSFADQNRLLAQLAPMHRDIVNKR